VLHAFIAAEAPADPGLAAAVAEQHSGYFYIIDQRTPDPYGDVPPWDVLGRFEVRDGSTDSSTYEANPNHHLLTDRGFFDLGARLNLALLAHLRALNAAPRQHGLR